MMKKRITLAALTLVTLGTLGGGGFFAYRTFFSDTEPAQQAEAPPEPGINMGPLYPLDPFLVNLADPGRPRFLKLSAHLELDSDAVSSELDTLKPKVRDALLTLLSSRTIADLVTVGDKEKLRNDMIHRLNAFLTNGRVVEVYFVDFVVQ